MRFVLLIFCALILNVQIANASEITGKISTDPKNPAGHYLSPVDNEENGENRNVDSGKKIGGGSALILRNRNYSLEENIGVNEIKVLGARLYPDGTLLRGSDKRIYLIKNGYKKHIASLEELKKYFGREIIDVVENDLAQYEQRPHLDGELIRQIGDEKVYIIENGGKRHIKSLEELRARYFGLEIYNLEEEEMSLYN